MKVEVAFFLLESHVLTIQRKVVQVEWRKNPIQERTHRWNGAENEEQGEAPVQIHRSDLSKWIVKQVGLVKVKYINISLDSLAGAVLAVLTVLAVYSVFAVFTILARSSYQIIIIF